MAVGQAGKNVVVSYKAESTFNTPVAGAGATQFRANPGNGLSLKRGNVIPGEFRKDAQRSMARLGYKDVSGSYIADLSVGTFDALFASLLRTTFGAVLTAAAADFTTLTTGTHTIVWTAGNPITKGFKVGDVLTLSSMPDSANNRNVRVTALSATTITVAETLVVNATPSAAPSIAAKKKAFNPAFGSIVRSSYTIEEYYEDLDDSKLFSGCRVTSCKLSFKPDGMVLVEFGFAGADMSVPGNAAAPNFTSPTLSTTIGLTANDAVIRFNGADVATLTSGDIMIDLKAKGQPVVGSIVTPDIWENTCEVTGSVTGIRTSMANESSFLAETEFELQLLCVDNAAEPKNYVSLYLPRVKMLAADAPYGADGAVIETLNLYAAAKDPTSGYDPTTVTIQTSAP